jgi:hypothetical protein
MVLPERWGRIHPSFKLLWSHLARIVKIRPNDIKLFKNNLIISDNKSQEYLHECKNSSAKRDNIYNVCHPNKDYQVYKDRENSYPF